MREVILPIKIRTTFPFSNSVFQACDHDWEIVCVMEVSRAHLVPWWNTYAINNFCLIRFDGQLNPAVFPLTLKCMLLTCESSNCELKPFSVTPWSKCICIALNHSCKRLHNAHIMEQQMWKCVSICCHTKRGWSTCFNRKKDSELRFFLLMHELDTSLQRHLISHQTLHFLCFHSSIYAIYAFFIKCHIKLDNSWTYTREAERILLSNFVFVWIFSKQHITKFCKWWLLLRYFKVKDN